MEKMRSGELYCFAAPELQESFERAATLCARMRTMTVYDENYRKTIEDLIPGIPSTSGLTLLFNATMARASCWAKMCL